MFTLVIGDNMLIEKKSSDCYYLIVETDDGKSEVDTKVYNIREEYNDASTKEIQNIFNNLEENQRVYQWKRYELVEDKKNKHTKINK